VAVCVLSGNVNVVGWDKSEVVVRSTEGAQIEFRNDKGAGPASKVHVVVIDKDDVLRTKSGCQALTDVEMNVPRGATVQVQTREGSISIAGVSTAYAGTQSGDINLERVLQVLEVGTIDGTVSVKDSSGRMDLNSVSGNVVVTNVKPLDPSDAFESTTVSGDLELEKVTHAQMNLRTVNGNMRLSGPLASGGRYGINTMSGDVTLALPADASFQLNAKVSAQADIITDFPLTLLESTSVASPATVVKAPRPPKPEVPVMPGPPGPPAPPAPADVKIVAPAPQAKPAAPVKVKPEVKATVVRTPVIVTTHSLRRLNAICGSGDALISVASFSGTVHLQRN
jgi:hypothetical protein